MWSRLNLERMFQKEIQMYKEIKNSNRLLQTEY